MGVLDWLSDNAGALGLGGAGLAFAKEGYDKLGRVGQQAYDAYSGEGGLADELRG